ncbi:hypothetical protein PN498_21860 [Oscillatoria sp. CS-180]|uniref:hypothetical protein n=1 Tax=Oscillatoria sp. CS-180 TaxID=3021720 RepID=UPI00232F9180|nr:hypothetical protein [Oscillatoria sp. CS-180]MDB9528653.1 hypothetical protein [Oscillatoria sp. CS-180]
MRRLLLSTLIMFISTGTFAAIANAEQVSLSNAAADLNGDGEVTLAELRRYNRDQRRN